jgi:hypothetical protein
MARDGSGTYTRVSNSFSNPVASTTINPTHADALFDDIETEITDSLSRTGKGGMSADLDMNNNDINEIKTAVFQGSTSGTTTVIATAIAGTTTLTLPAVTGKLVAETALQFVTPEQHGAVGDGTTDDYTAVSNAVAAALSANVPFVTTKTYALGTSLNITTSGLTWVGWGSTIVKKSGSTLTTLVHLGATSGTNTITDCIIVGTTFDGATGCSEAVFKARNHQRCQFLECSYTGGASHGLLTDTSTTSINTQVLRNVYSGGVSFSNGGSGYFWTGEKDSRFIGMLSRNNTGNGFNWKAFIDDGNLLAETTQCVGGDLSARDNTGDAYVFDGCEKFVFSSLLSAINGGYGIRFMSTVTGATSVALNSVNIANFTSRNDALGGIRAADSANCIGASFGTVLIIGFNSSTGTSAIDLRGASYVNFATVNITGWPGTGIRLIQGTPLGVTTQCQHIRFGEVLLNGNGNASSSANHGISLENSPDDITFGSVYSANTQTTGTNYEINCASTAVGVVFGYANLNASSSGNELNITNADVTFSQLKLRTGAVLATLLDGVTAPSASVASHALLYVDTADGDLKVRFADGTIKTIVVDT